MMVRQDIPETESVVEHAENHLHQSLAATFLLEIHHHFVVMVANGLILAPHLVPCLVFRRTVYPGHLGMSTNLVLVQQEAKV